MIHPIPGADRSPAVPVPRLARRLWVPVLLLTACQSVTDRVQGLDAGADDYLTKPFALAELLARVRAVTRRKPAGRPAVPQVADLTLDPVAHTVHRGSEEIAVSPREFALLHELMRHPGQVLARAWLTDHVFDFAHDGSNVVDVYIRYLRDKIDRPYGRQSIRTVRGVGYRLER
jgi:two-component system OmpR family response regulator